MVVHRLDETLKQLIQVGQQQGHLTFSQIGDYLPDEAVDSEKLDILLTSLEELGMEIRSGDERVGPAPRQKAAMNDTAHAPSTDKRPPHFDDSLRLYLMQMGETQLLSRTQ